MNNEEAAKKLQPYLRAIHEELLGELRGVVVKYTERFIQEDVPEELKDHAYYAITAKIASICLGLGLNGVLLSSGYSDSKKIGLWTEKMMFFIEENAEEFLAEINRINIQRN